MKMVMMVIKMLMVMVCRINPNGQNLKKNIWYFIWPGHHHPLPYHVCPQISYDINDDDDLTTPVSSADIARSLLVGKKQSGLQTS